MAPGVQTEKQKELSQLRLQEQNQLASAVLKQHAEEQRAAGEVANLHKNNIVLRECVSNSYPKHPPLQKQVYYAYQPPHK